MNSERMSQKKVSSTTDRGVNKNVGRTERRRQYTKQWQHNERNDIIVIYNKPHVKRKALL